MTGCLAAARGWRPGDRIERDAADRMRAFGPETGGAAVYVAFPWAALIDSLVAPLDDPELAVLHADVLRAALRALCANIPPGAAALTVCQHPGLRDRFDLMTQAGITDVFWTHATAADLRDDAVPGLRIRPYPALSDTASRTAPDIAPDIAPDDTGSLHATASSSDAAPPTDSTIPRDTPACPDGPSAGEGPGAAFAFCPGDNGGNTPRLWAAIAAGLVPVIPLAEAALPGLPTLWRDGAVFHDDQPGDRPGDRGALDSRLAAIAADPDRLAAMRAALDQLWLLYGTGRSAHGVALRMIDLACAAAAAAPRPPATDPLSFEAARHVLRAAAGDLLLRGAPAAGPDIETALARLPALAPARLHFEAVRAHLQKPAPVSIPAPGHTTGQPPAIFLLGPRGQRTPLAYDPLRREAGARVRFVDRPERADLILTGWNRDLEDNRDRLRVLLRDRPATRIAVISEEPLWDSLWSGGFAARDRRLSAGEEAEIPYRFLNHANCGIFDFRRIPYFLLTRDSFPARYATLIAGFAGLTPTALLQHWRDTPLRYAVFAAYRDTADYAASVPEQGLYGLSLYRSRVAALTPEDGVLRVGQGWAGTGPPRQALPDWHLDKLARLHGRVRVCAAQENTLMRDYITEKPFDAFAVGAIPAVVVGPDHRLGEFLEPDAMLDTAGLAPDLAAARIATFVPDRVTADAWLVSAARLVALMRDTDALIAERRRVVDATLAEIAALV